MAWSRAGSALCVVVLLAGCSGSPGPAGDSEAETELTEIAPGIFVTSGLSAVRGTVVTDAGLIVADAHVLLFGTDFAMDTNDDGEFLFLNVTPGPTTLRVEKTGFRVLEDPIDLSPNNLTERALVLLPDETVGAGYREHVHDYWGDQASLLMMDESVNLGGSAQRSVAYANLGTTTSYDFPFHPSPTAPGGQVALIYPGTETLTVTISWTSQDVTLSALQLKYRSAAGGDVMLLEEHASGVPWVIPVTPEMADNGHQAFTLWQFAINSGNDVRNAPNWEPGAILGSVRIKMEVTKGQLRLEPGHPDFWVNGTGLVLREAAEEYRISYSVADSSRETSNSGLIHLGAFKIVPPGTTRLRAELTWSNARTPNPPTESWVLTWRSAEQHPYKTPFAQYHRAAPVDSGAGFVTYEFPVEAAQTDAYYQRLSLWRFLPSKAGDESRTQIYYEDFALDYIFRLKVTAYNDGLPA